MPSNVIEKGIRNVNILRSLLVALALWVVASPIEAAPPGQTDRIIAAGREQRDSDPFVFCRYGLKKRRPAWKPMRPYTVGYIPQLGFCPYPSLTPCCYGWVCLRAWPAEDYYAYTTQYVTICPQAGSQGGKNWNGSGDGTKVDSRGRNDH
jgi:hypothetical protein